jgi:hypothetical protein
MNNYHPFREEFSTDIWGVNNTTPERRFTRNFEELITERGDVTIFEKVKEKIFVSSHSDDVELFADDFLKFNQKYNTKEVDSSIKLLKENISNFYIKKLEHSVLIQERRRMFESFCNNIIESIKMIDEIAKECNTEEDTHLKTLLSDRIDSYYKQLDIDNLVNMEYCINSEFAFLKQSFIEKKIIFRKR